MVLFEGPLLFLMLSILSRLFCRPLGASLPMFSGATIEFFCSGVRPCLVVPPLVSELTNFLMECFHHPLPRLRCIEHVLEQRTLGMVSPGVPHCLCTDMSGVAMRRVFFAATTTTTTCVLILHCICCHLIAAFRARTPGEAGWGRGCGHSRRR